MIQFGETALALACGHGQTAAVQMLLQHEADPMLLDQVWKFVVNENVFVHGFFNHHLACS